MQPISGINCQYVNGDIHIPKHPYILLYPPKNQSKSSFLRFDHRVTLLYKRLDQTTTHEKRSVLLQTHNLAVLTQQLTAVLQHPHLHLRLERRLQVDSQVHTYLLDVVHHQTLIVAEICLLRLRYIAFLGIIEVTSVQPKLILHALAPEVVVYQHEPLDSVCLV